MIGIVIVAHGHLAREYLAAIEHVVGHQEGIRAIEIEANHVRSDKEHEICAAADAVDTGNGVVMVTDLWGSSPSNLCIAASAIADRWLISGANLPMLIKLAKSRDKHVAEAVRDAEDAGKKYITSRNIGPKNKRLR